MKRIKAVILSVLLIISTLAPAVAVSAATKSAANTKIDPKLAVPPLFSASQYAILNPVTAIECGFNIQKMYNYYVQTGVYSGQRIFATPVPMPIEKVFQYMARNRNYYIEHGKEEGFAYLDLSNYILQNMDLYPVLGADTDMWLYHYINFGVYEGRSCGTAVDPVKVILWNPAIAEFNNPGLAPDKILANFALVADKIDTSSLQTVVNKDGAATSAVKTASSSSSNDDEEEKHTIKWSLDNVKTSNSDKSVKDGASFKATLTAKDDYEIDEVTIKMGGKVITDDVYTSSTGKIKISKVTGDVSITAKAVSTLPDTYGVTWILNNVTCASSGDTNKPRGAYWKDKLVVKDGFEMSSVSITMGGKVIDVYDEATGYFTIDNVTGKIIITATAVPTTVEYSISRELDGHVSSSSTATKITAGASHTETISADTGYAIGSVTVTMGGIDVTATAYTAATGVISISAINGNLVITATDNDERTWSAWEEDTENAGKHKRTCAETGEVETVSCTYSDWSSWTEDSTNPGKHTRMHSCTVCGHTETETEDCTYGAWSAWEPDVDDDTVHIRERECSKCGHTETGTGAHDTDGTGGTCSVCGYDPTP